MPWCLFLCIFVLLLAFFIVIILVGVVVVVFIIVGVIVGVVVFVVVCCWRCQCCCCCCFLAVICIFQGNFARVQVICSHTCMYDCIMLQGIFFLLSVSWAKLICFHYDSWFVFLLLLFMYCVPVIMNNTFFPS